MYLFVRGSLPVAFLVESEKLDLTRTRAKRGNNYHNMISKLNASFKSTHNTIIFYAYSGRAKM